jgi:tryptophan synthase alpha chain
VNRIERTFENLKREGRTALIPFLTAGDPDLETTKSLVLEMEKKGADIVELGIPFSDPLADGPTIQASSERSLKKGTTLKKVLLIVKELRKKTEIPLVLMTYYNPVYQFGLNRFVKEAVRNGVDGVIVPDLSPEEGENLRKKAEKEGLALIFLLSPTSSLKRIRLVAEKTKGFLYYVSLAGVTGARDKLSSTIRSSLAKIRGWTDKPIAVGFGISRPEQAREIASWAQGVIVGSALVNIIAKNQKNKNLVKLVGDFISKLNKGVTKKLL